MTLEPGLDLHDWETRWQELEDLAAESPAEALPELVRLAEQMAAERGQNPDIEKNLLAARELAAACQAGTATAGDTAAALENLREVHDFLVEERPL